MNQNRADTHIYASEREVFMLKERLLEAKISHDAGRAQAALIETVEGLIEQLGKQARVIEDLRSDLTHKQGIVTRIGGGDYRGEAAPKGLREFSTSSNGDCWLLGRDEHSGAPYVEHRANQPSGGAVTHLAVDAFLRQGTGSPEGEALLRLLATLAVEPPSTRAP